MNALTFPKSPAAAVRAEQRAQRRADLIATIPAIVQTHADLHAFCEGYAAIAAGLNKRQLARVVWPWARIHDPKRPAHISQGRWRRIGQSVRPQTPRDRASNPTALR